MKEEEKTNESALNQSTTNPVAEAQALNELNAQIVKLKAENADLQEAKRQYYDSIINGNSDDDSIDEQQFRSAKEIRAEMEESANDMTNLKYATLAVELNEAVLREGGESIFLPKGKNVTPTFEEKDVAQRFPEVLKECIERAEGNPDVFNSEFKRHTRN